MNHFLFFLVAAPLLTVIPCLAGETLGNDPAAHTTNSSRPGSFSVEVVGHGKPMILIPGLTCGGSVWNTTVEHFKARYECHILALAGFAGEPAIAAKPMLENVRNDIAVYIRQKKLAQPVIVGHSLGGFLSFWIAAAEPTLVGPVISVDGGTFFPALMDPKATRESSKAGAESLRQSMEGQTSEQFAAANKMFLSYMITDPKNLELIAPICAKSDPKAVSLAMYELMTTDLRDEVAKIKTPVLLIGAGAASPQGKKEIEDLYEAQVAKIPVHKVVIDEKAKHFIMLDDSDFLFSTMDNFLAAPAAK